MGLIKSKTFWTGLTGVVAAGAGFATGDLSGAEALQTGLLGLTGIFMRMAIAKAVKVAAP
jgi:hypothetical protein